MTSSASPIPSSSASPIPPSDAVSMSAQTIFFHARAAASNRSCSGRLDYHIVVVARIHGDDVTDRFDASYSGDLDELHVNSQSDEESAHPYTPRGVNIAIAIAGAPIEPLSDALSQRLNRDAPSELLGVPRLKPTYMFGLAATPDTKDVPVQPIPAPSSSYRTIGLATSSYSRDYDVRLESSQMLGARAPYHLRLTPRREPGRYRLRDLWVDATSFLPLQILSAGNFSAGPPTRVPWLTTYRDVLGCRVIDREIALGPLDYGGRGTYAATTIRFEYDLDASRHEQPTFVFQRPIAKDDVLEPVERTTTQP